MDAHKRYSLLLIFLLTAAMAALLAVGFYLEPLTGDLTRVGGYAENDFGWNRPQKVFDHRTPPLRMGYGQYADVLVLGDSFAFGGIDERADFAWQTFLSLKTGWSAATINHYSHTDPPEYGPNALAKLVESEVFQKSPPRLFVLEVIERQLNLLPAYAGNCKAEHKITQRPEFSQNSLPLPLVEIGRNKVRPPLQQHIAYVWKYLSGLVLRPWDKKPLVYQLPLTTGRYFSNKLNDQLLVFEGDVKRKPWSEQQIAGIRCLLMNAQNLVQKNGKTLFVAMVIPDKLSVYSRFLRNPAYTEPTVIDSLASDPALHLLRVDRAIHEAIEEGVVDLYLPNDLHWGYRGHALAADVLTRYLAHFPGD